MVSVTPRPHFISGKDPVPIIQGAGWAPGPVWTGGENLAPTGIRSPDLPIRNQIIMLLQLLKLIFLNSLQHLSLEKIIKEIYST
jgi:hypothetical protein